jgi:DNA-binding SARP family transcriptional activator
VRRLAVDHTDHDTQPRSSTHVGSAVASSVTGVTSSGRPDQLDLPLGERDGRTVLLDAATTYGLGLTGPGALPTARALLLSVLTTHRGAHAILAADDLHALAPTASRTGRAVNRRLSVPAGPAEALAHLEAAILTRTRLLEESAGQHTPPPLLLVISVPTDPRRLQAIADLGAGLAIAVLVLGPWPAGLTCHIDAAGHITTQDATPDPDWSSTLHGLHAYAADADTTQELLALLAHDATRTADHRADATAQSIPHPAAPPVRHQPTAPPRPEHDPTPSDIAHRLAPGPDATPSQTTTAAALSTGGATSDTARSHAPRPRTPDSPTTHTPVKPIRLNLLGHFHVHYHASTTDTPRDITDRFSPRERDILTYLALHPDGTRRDSLIVALWPDNPGDRPSASLHARLSHIRHTLRTVTDHHIDTLTTHHDGYYALDPATVEVDLWQLTDALHTHYHATDPRERTAALHEIAQLYQGQLADTITGEWIDTARQALHRDALDAFAALIRTVRDTDPEHALELLEHARTLDRHNEAIYRDIIRLQTRLGHHDSIPRTVELLRTALAEIDATPMASTLALASGAHGTTSDTTPDTP